MRVLSLETKKVDTLDKSMGKDGLNSNESLAEIQKTLRAAQAEVKRERLARIKAEKALVEAQEKQADAPLDAERKPLPQTSRVSFVVRLTLDKQGQFCRSEIEHVSSGRKQNFRSLNGERLVEFMKACINPEAISKDAIPTKPL